ncbi:MAG: hypothetical protein JW820_00240 [Spirochaetales bacterium]|nr:hypothetical protein [Spirochaetales bacterium]
MTTFRLRSPSRLLPALLVVGMLAAPALLTGCGLFRSRLITLCTSCPEMAAYVELFNALGPDLQVVLCYQPDPAGQVASHSAKADVVVGCGLEGLFARRHLAPLDRLFGEEGLKREDFYEGLLDAGLHERRQVSLPLSFRLPAVVFLTGAFEEGLPNLSVGLEYLRESAGAFNRVDRDRYVRMGFSPLWDDRFLYEALSLNGAGFREGEEGELRWDEAGLSAGVSFLRAWVEEFNGGFSRNAEFSRKYLYEPMARLVDEQRILFYLSDSGRLAESLEAHADVADFRWLEGEAGIRVDESVVSIGIPRSSRNKWGARIFVDWLLDEATQKRLLEVNRSKRLSTFGLFGGFSSLRSVTELEFPQEYPLLIGRIPPAELLDFPQALPTSWETLKTDAVVPWLRDFLASGTPADEASRALESWIETYRAELPANL